MRNLLIISTLLLSLTSYSQNTGLYGKKFCIDIGGSGSFPLFNMRNGEMYKYKGGELVSKIDLFDYSLRTGVSYALAKNFSLGLEFDMDFLNIAAPESIDFEYTTSSYYYSGTRIKHEALNVHSFVFMPRMSFASKNALLPIGLSHQVGIGMSYSKIKERDYQYKLLVTPDNLGNIPDTADFHNRLYNYDNDAVKGLVFMYSLNVRTPINQFMMITYGFRYEINIGLKDIANGSDPDYFMSIRTAYDNIKTRRRNSIISLNLGVAFAL